MASIVMKEVRDAREKNSNTFGGTLFKTIRIHATTPIPLLHVCKQQMAKWNIMGEISFPFHIESFATRFQNRF